MAHQLEVLGLDKFYGSVHAVRNLSLTIEPGEMLFLLGPSGSGKTTTLRAVAGLESVEAGDIRLQQRSIIGLEPGERDIGMVFQTFSMFPTLSPFENVAFPLKVLGLGKNEIHERVGRLVRYLELEHLLEKATAELSDGDKQRLSIARAIIRRPALLLFDEPLTFLDAKLRMSLGAELRQLQQDMALSGLYVTHDQNEAMLMGDRVGVMNEGVLLQIGTPSEVYETPATTFVARFVGSPGMNILPGRVMAGGILESDYLLHELELTGLQGKTGDVLFGVRPQGLHVGGPRRDLRLQVDFVEWMGNVAFAHGMARDMRVVAQIGADARPAHGDVVEASIGLSSLHLYDSDGARLNLDVRAVQRV